MPTKGRPLCAYLVEAHPFCTRRRYGLRCATGRLIEIAQRLSPSRPIELLQLAAARLALRQGAPVSILVNRAARACLRAEELEAELDCVDDGEPPER